MNATEMERILGMIRLLQHRANSLHETLAAHPDHGCLTAEINAFLLHEELQRLESVLLESEPLETA